jgi:hypothetical protein
MPNKFEELNTEVNEDFLEVDKSIPGQNFVCLSFVSPDKLLARKEDYYFHEYNKKRFQILQKEMSDKFDEAVKSGDLNGLKEAFLKATDLQVKQTFSDFTEEFKDFRYANEEAVEQKFHEDNNFQTTIRGIKVRGVYNTVKEAQIRAKVLQRLDPSFHIFVGQVGYWLPWDPNADKIENQEYQNNQLNEIVKKYKVNESKRDEFYEQQKQERKKEAIKKVSEAKELTNGDESTEEKPALATGSANDAEVSIEETKNKLTDVDPWLERKMKAASEDEVSVPVESSETTDYHEDPLAELD